MKVRHLKRRVRPRAVNPLQRAFLLLRATVLHSQQRLIDKVMVPALNKILEDLLSNPPFARPTNSGSISGNTN